MSRELIITEEEIFEEFCECCGPETVEIIIVFNDTKGKK